MPLGCAVIPLSAIVQCASSHSCFGPKFSLSKDYRLPTGSQRGRCLAPSHTNLSIGVGARHRGTVVEGQEPLHIRTRTRTLSDNAYSTNAKVSTRARVFSHFFGRVFLTIPYATSTTQCLEGH
jgi:hypothetical protein